MDIIRQLRRGVSRFPLKTLFVVVLLCYADLRYPPLTLKADFAEFYPLSSFPMYSSFSPATNYVYLTNAEDAPLPAYPMTGSVSSALKKAYLDHLRQLKAKLKIPMHRMTPEQKKPAGDALLAELLQLGDAEALRKQDHVKLYEVIISRNEKDEIVRNTFFITEFRKSGS